MNDTNLVQARESSRHLAALLRREHVALADFLVALSEFDRAGAYRRLGYANLFDYLLRELHISRGAAHYRKVAARLVARFPEVVEPLRDGRLCLSSIVQLAKVMTKANRTESLPRFFHCSKQEAKQVAVEIMPAAVVPRRTVVTEIPPPVKSTTSPVHPGELSATAPECAPVPAREPARTVVEPLTSTMSRLHLTVSRVFVGKLRKARAGQSHVQPGATDEQVIDAALDLLLAQQERRRAGVPPRVKREVRKRDGGKCQWKLDSGGVCGSEVRTEIDHVVPRGDAAAPPRWRTVASSASITGRPPATPTATRTWTCSPGEDPRAAHRWRGRRSRPTGRRHDRHGSPGSGRHPVPMRGLSADGFGVS